MSYYAKFIQVCGHTFRLDTRIYLDPKATPQPGDQCIAAIIAKNPGTATKSVNIAYGSLGRLSLGCDKLLPTVRSVFLKAFGLKGIYLGNNSLKGKYIQVLNLFYLCEPDLPKAKRWLSTQGGSPKPIDPAEGQCFPVIWYAWGPSDRVLDPLKNRFLTPCRPPPTHHIYYSGVVNFPPLNFPKVKHPQGMPHLDFVPALAKII